MRYGYSILLDLRDRLVVIVGGGEVAARKAAGVLSAGAREVVCVAPSISHAMPVEVRRMEEAFEDRHLEGAGLVFAATDSAEVNASVVEAARRRGVWVNWAGQATKRRSDEATEGWEGDFVVPAVHRAGGVAVAVSVGGAPALAAAVRDDLARKLDERWVKLSEAMGELRRRVLAQVDDPRRRREVLRRLASLEAAEMLEREGMEGLWRWASGAG